MGIVTSAASVTWPQALDTIWLTMMFHFVKFLIKEEIPAVEIHQRFQRAYGEMCMDASSVIQRYWKERDEFRWEKKSYYNTMTRRLTLLVETEEVEETSWEITLHLPIAIILFEINHTYILYTYICKLIFFLFQPQTIHYIW